MIKCEHKIMLHMCTCFLLAAFCLVPFLNIWKFKAFTELLHVEEMAFHTEI